MLAPVCQTEAWLLKVLTSITNLGLYTTKNEGDVLTDSQLDQGFSEGHAVGCAQSQDEFSMRTFEREVGFCLLKESLANPLRLQSGRPEADDS